MASKRIVDVDVVTSVGDNDFYFINQNQSIKQIKKTSVPKPTYTPEEVGAIPKTDIATLVEMKAYLGL